MIKKANQINKSNGPFDSIILLGDSVNDVSQLLSSPAVQSLEAPTFFVQGLNELNIGDHQDIKNLENENENKNHAKDPSSSITVSESSLKYLGSQGVKILPNGLTLGFVSGKVAKDYAENTNTAINKEPNSIEETFKDRKVDILIMYQWPSVIAKQQNASILGNSILDAVVRHCQPRYIFACGKPGGISFELDAFKWEDTLRVTRFISLGEYKSEKKWFYAFNISGKIDSDATDGSLAENPYTTLTKNMDKEETSSTNSTTDTNSLALPKKPDTSNATILGQKRAPSANNSENEIAKKRKTVNPKSCFFCLSNPDAETHMIISIGNSCYMTIAKGPLTKPTKFHNKPISGHVLVIPINHIPNVNSVAAITGIRSIENGEETKVSETTDDSTTKNESKNGDALEVDILNDLKKFDDSLKLFFWKEFEMGYSRFEINTKSSVHYHRQIFPFNLHVSISKFYDFLKSFESKCNTNSGGRNAILAKCKFNFMLVRKENPEDSKDTTSLNTRIKEIVGERGEYISIELSVINTDLQRNTKVQEDENKTEESTQSTQEVEIDQQSNDAGNGNGDADANPLSSPKPTIAGTPESYFFVTAVDSTKYVDLQFPRKLFAFFLNLKNRAHWTKCTQSKEIELLEVESFRNLYKNYDFTLS